MIKRLMGATALWCLLLTPASAIELEPGPVDSLVVNYVAMLMSEVHYESTEMNNERSELWFDNYIDALDYNHMVFTQGDVETLSSHRYNLDDEAAGKAEPLAGAIAIYQRYQGRLKDRIDEVLIFLATDISLKEQGTWTLDRSEMAWPETEADAQSLWRGRVVEQMIEGRLQGREHAEQVDLLRKRYERIRRELDQTKMVDVLEIFLSALTRTYDPHSAYFKPSTSDNFDIEMSNSLEGIGATLRTDGEYTIVVNLVAGGPADQEGSLRPGDKIIEVCQGVTGEYIDIVAWRLDDVVQQIRGKAMSIVRLKVIPADAASVAEIKVVQITRDKVIIEESKASGSVKEVTRGDRKLRLGVIDVPSFYVGPNSWTEGGVTDDLRRIINELESDNIDGLVLDLRYNGGGSLDEAVDMTGLFIDRGPVVQIRERDGEVHHLKDERRGMAYDGPLVLLTSIYSASASEIVAGAIQDYGRGIIVGDKSTHGKGTVQTIYDVNRILSSRMMEDSPENAGGALKLTTQKFYRASGSSTQIKGVRSDIVIPSNHGEDSLEGDLDFVLPWDEAPRAAYQVVGDLWTKVPELQAASNKRVATNEYFRWIEVLMTEREALDARTTVALDFDARKAEADDREARVGESPFGDTQESEDDADPYEKDTDRPDPVLDEGLEILADFCVSVD